MNKEKVCPMICTPGTQTRTFELRSEVCASCLQKEICQTMEEYARFWGSAKMTKLFSIPTRIKRKTLFDHLGIPQVVRKDRGRAPKMQGKVYAMLLRGKRSVGDISAALHIADPRGHIRDLRAKGINIVDEWCTGEDGVRYKHYWVAKEETV